MAKLLSVISELLGYSSYEEFPLSRGLLRAEFHQFVSTKRFVLTTRFVSTTRFSQAIAMHTNEGNTTPRRQRE